MSSTPVSKVKSCCVSGCLEPRLQRGYCKLHQNGVVGKSDRPVRQADLQPAVQYVLDSIQAGAGGAAAAAAASSNGSPEKAASSSSSSSSSAHSNPYLQLLVPLTKRLLDNITNHASALPIKGSELDIFSFSTIGAATAAAVGAGEIASAIGGGTPPRPAPSPSPDSQNGSSMNGSSSSNLGGSPSHNPLAPLIDIQVLLTKKKVPAGFELLEHTVSGKFDADLNKGGNGKTVYLAYQRGEVVDEAAVAAEAAAAAAAAAAKAEEEQSRNSASNSEDTAGSDANGDALPTTSKKKKKECSSSSSSAPVVPAQLKPITSVCIIYRDSHEEPPYGFVCVEKNAAGSEANLNHHSHSNAPGRRMFLCVHRGEGAPIVDLGLILHAQRETLPAGFHEVKHTPFGSRANLNAAFNALDETAANAIPLAQQASQSVYLCFRPNVTPVLQTYVGLLADPTGSADAASRGHLLSAQTLALLTALLYSSDQKMVILALDAFSKIPLESIPALLLNRFIQCLCDASPCFHTYFTTQAHTYLLKFLLSAFKSFYTLLSIDSLAKMVEVCFLTRHEDKLGEISEKMVSFLMHKIERCKPCACQIQERKDAANAAANHSAMYTSNARKKDKDAGAAAAAAAAAPTSAAAASPASAASAVDRSNAAASTSGQSMSSIPCSKCQWTRAFHAPSVSTPSFCRELTLQLLGHVFTAKDIEADVKSFQRHTNTGLEFRADVAKITNQLHNIDQAHAAHIEDQLAANGGAASAPGGPPPAGSRAAGAGRGSIIGSLGLLSVQDDSASSSLATPASSSAASAAFAFDEVKVGGGVQTGTLRKVAEKDRVYIANKEERFLCVVTLLCAKFASESVPFGLVKSEQLKRKTHALRLLFYILQEGVYFFRATPGGMLLVRRFVCPALMSVCVTDSSLLWRNLLETFTVLYDQYRSFLMIELGVFFDHILLSLLESPLMTHDLKKDIVEFFDYLMAKGAEHLIHLFYNYDNHSKNWNIFDRLSTVLARIAQGDQKSFVPMHLSASAQASVAAQTAQAAGGAAPAAVSAQSSSTPDQRAEYIELKDDALQRQALRLLVHNLHMLAQWVGVPGMKRPPSIQTVPLISDDDMSLEPSFDAAGPAAAAASSAASSTVSAGPKTAKDRMQDVRRSSRVDTWSWRHDKQKQDQKIMQEALKLARTDKLKSALQYLRVVDPTYANPKTIAGFLYSNDALDKADVGDFLGSCGDKFMGDEDYETLRNAYLEHLDFTGLSFDAGLRLFLCDSNFRLPGEAQKIDRLLEAFCKAYCRDNPAIFRNHSSAFVVSFALVMLNTDLHDARLKSGTSHRQPMTEAQFISNLRGVDDGHNFPRVFLETLYKNIAAQAIEWKEKSMTSASILAAEALAAANQTELEKLEDQAKAVRKTYELTLRRALASLKNQAAHDQGYNRTSNTHIVAAMFEVCWYPIISALTMRSDGYKQGDVELLFICLEGLTYGATVAIALGLPTERQAFSRQLAKITFIERNRESIKAPNMHLRIVQGEHLKQEWYRPFNLMCDKSPGRACRLVFDTSFHIKQKINYVQRQARLRAIEGDFAHEIVLVDPSRTFVKEGFLIKWANSSASKQQNYMFMLFNDLILYASEGTTSKWKCHRVIHLSLCRLEDLRGIAYENAFRIVSPQKTFIVTAPTKVAKQQWLQSILYHTEQIHAIITMRRAQLAKAAGGAAGSSAPGSAASASSPLSPDGDIPLESRWTQPLSDGDLNASGSASGLNIGGAFGQSSIKGEGAAASSSAAAAAAAVRPNCKLCIRPWAIFRRKQKCRVCNDSVCNDCCSQKALVPGGEKKLVNVCDACYGVFKGMIGEGVKLLTVCDT